MARRRGARRIIRRRRHGIGKKPAGYVGGWAGVDHSKYPHPRRHGVGKWVKKILGSVKVEKGHDIRIVGGPKGNSR